MKKHICFILVLILFVWLSPVCLALEAPQPVREYLDQSPLTPESFSSLGLSGILRWVWSLVETKLYEPFHLFSRLMLAMGAGALAYTFAPGSGTNTLLETFLLLCLFLQAADPLLGLMEKVCLGLSSWSNYLAGFVPVFSGVMATCGQTATSLVYSGMFLSMAFLTSQLIVQAGIPLLQSFLALNAAGCICRISGIGDICQMILKGIRWIIRFSSVLFGAVLSLQTMLSHSADSLAMQTGKFLIGNGIPIVGQTASSALGSVLAGLKILKSSLGFAAIAFVAAGFLPLMAECCLYSFIFSFCAGTAKSMEYPFCAKALESMSQTAELCTAMLVFFFMLVVLSTSLMILCGGGFS